MRGYAPHINDKPAVNQCKRYDYVDINYFIGLKFQRNDVDIMVFDYLKCYVDIINSFKTSI